MFSKIRAQFGSKRSNSEQGLGFGTAPVFLTSVTTILGAILFLRFGYAVGNVGLGGTLMIIVLGHLVTIPTVLAVSEIATNRRVAGGGAYYIVSRSFGTSIAGRSDLLYTSPQAISVAFYMVAFAEAFGPVYEWIFNRYEVQLDPRWLSVPGTLLLIALMLTKRRRYGDVNIVGCQCDLRGIHSDFLSRSGSRIHTTRRLESHGSRRKR